VKPNDSLAPLIYQKLQNDEPIVLSKANGGQGAIVQPSATPSPTASPKALSNTTANQTSHAKPAALVTLKTSATPSPTPLPDSIIGSHASDKTCSN
jgi:hypothetical protein